MVLLLNKYISFLQPNVIYAAIPSPPRLRSQLKDGTRHLANDTSVYVNTPRVPSVHLPAVGGLAAEAESQRDCCLVTVTMDATLRRGLRCNGFKLNCWIWSWQRGNEGKKRGRRRTAVETEGGGSDRNSLSIKKDREVERDRDSQPERQWATDRGEEGERGGGRSESPHHLWWGAGRAVIVPERRVGALLGTEIWMSRAALLPAMLVAHHSVRPVFTRRWGPAGTLTFYVGSH